jgi:tetratricopeptide (TPR) repeat protein
MKEIANKNKKVCFVIMGYGTRTDYSTGQTINLDKTFQNIIKPSIETAGYICIRGDEVQESSIIDKNMFGLLIYADLVIADITTLNPNTIYELGVRHAAKPYSTIVMKEKACDLPFDFSHNRIFIYSHLGEDIGYSEAERCKKDLVSLINTLDKSKEIDSPLFSCLSIAPHELPEKDYTVLIKELSERDNLFAIVERAKTEMQNNNFAEATQLWRKVCEKAGADPYYIQQYALCTYKSKQPSEKTALTEALCIIKRLEPDNKTTDPETLGIAGSINKRLWLLTKDIEYLNKAIFYYKKGFNLNSDYYTGENYALCLELKHEQIMYVEEKVYYKFEAKKTREQIVKIIEQLKERGGEDFEKRNDIRWIYATLAHCHFSLGNEDLHSAYEDKFKALNQADWEWDTYNDSKQQITKLK